VIEGTGPDPHQHLSRPRFRVRDIRVLENVQFAVFVKTERFH